MGLYYILAGHNTVKTDSVTEWGRMMENMDKRRVGSTENNDISVSTVFLGIDHSFGDGPPLLFETMIFGGEHDEDVERYSTWDEAEVGHKKMCEKAFS